MNFTITSKGAIPAGLGANARGNRFKLNKIAQDWRELWRVLALNEIRRLGIDIPLDHVTIQVTGYFNRGRGSDPRSFLARAGTQRPHDLDNLQSCMKAAIDGLVAAGLVPDDRAEYVSLEQPRLERVDDWADERVELRVTVP